jgi:hypothetical protein
LAHSIEQGKLKDKVTNLNQDLTGRAKPPEATQSHRKAI